MAGIIAFDNTFSDNRNRYQIVFLRSYGQLLCYYYATI